jgi:late competence protein required for DNA uptake (superfamily II DNA/RNA helicase)
MKSGLPKKIADEIEKFKAEKLQRGRIKPHLGPPPQEIICKICKKVMDDPVLIDSGYTYCRQCISGHDICPQRNVHFYNLVDNLALKGVIAWSAPISISVFCLSSALWAFDWLIESVGALSIRLEICTKFDIFLLE